MFVHDIYWTQMSPQALVFVGWLAAAAAMAVLWAWHLRLRNAGVVDVGWTACVGGLAVLYGMFGGGDGTRRLVIAGMMALWSGRLAWYLLRDRVLGRAEDGRYAELRARGSYAAAGRFFPFFQAQAMLAVLFSFPAWIAAINPAPGLSAIEIAAIALWAFALAGEATADAQLERFKAEPSHRGRTCREGLWRYSRHPNYFFEWLVWVAYALFAAASPYGWMALACPLLMLYLLFRVTGIPATEAQALRTRGEDYRRYQATTSAFVPWLPKGTR
jgi:steroid 5-alpha reductase family enzyme